LLLGNPVEGIFEEELEFLCGEDQGVMLVTQLPRREK